MGFGLACDSAPEEPMQAPPAVEPAASPAPTPPADRPNLVLVSIDTLRADRLGAYGHDRPTSPHLDRFAAAGTLFANAFSHSPKTAPSHMTLMTGVYPEAHRVQNPFLVSPDAKIVELGPGIPLLAEILHAAGYKTVARTAGGNVAGAIGFERGFDAYSGSGNPGVEAIFGAAMADLAAFAGGDAPFFLFVHTYAVHAPYLPPKRYADLFTDPAYSGNIVADAELLRAESGGKYYALHEAFFERVNPADPADVQHLLDLYDACIRQADDQLGALLDRIDALGLADDTVVVVLSDHGEEFQEHGAFEHDGLWEQLLRVPLVFRVPEAVRPGWSARRVTASVGLVDVMPTLLDLLGLPIPDHVQGLSLADVVAGSAAGRGWQFAENRELGSVALRAGDWKLLRERKGQPPKLFDLARDPAERHDQATIRPDKERAAMRRIRKVTAQSRATWSLVGEGARAAPPSDMQEQLRALGYVDDSAPERPEAPP